MEQAIKPPHDIQPLMPYVWGIYDWTLVVLALVALIFLLFFSKWIWRRFRARKDKTLAGPSTYEKLMQRLQGLKPDASAAVGKQYYLDLSMIMREYLEAFFRLRSTDMTVQELLKFLPLYLPAKFSEQSRLREFFLRVEEIVFAGRISPAEEAEQWHKKVGDWIKNLEEIRNRPVAPAQEKS